MKNTLSKAALLKIKECVEASDKEYCDDDVENYKAFAGWNVKHEMLKSVYKGYRIVLDIASGRGNDINRWALLKIPRVIGVEYDMDQFRESITRYSKVSKSIRTKINFLNLSAMDEDLKNKIQASARTSENFNLITCFFALNHFYSEVFFKNISSMLKEGGMFVGTATDGDMIKFLFKHFGKKLDTKLYFLEKIDNDTYDFKINTPFFKKSDEYSTIRENIIKKQHFVERMLRHGLVPYSIKQGVPGIFNLLNCPLVVSDITGEYYKRHIDLASLYFGFSFKKVSKDVLKCVKSPKCKEVLLNEEIDVETLKGYNYFIFKKNKDIQLPEDFYCTYPVNPIKICKETHDYLSENRYTSVEHWDAISIGLEQLLTEKMDFPTNYDILSKIENVTNYVVDFYE